MKLKPSLGWFLAFTAAFAVLAGFVFWGTWATDMAPVMPDHPITWPAHYGARLTDWWNGFRASGKWTPFEIFSFVGTPYLWQEFRYALALYLAGLGLAWTLRGPGFNDGRGLSPVAAYGAGLLLAFSGYWCTLFSAGHYGWFQWMAFGVWPFGLIDRAMHQAPGTRHWLLLGACLAWGSMFQSDLWLLFTVFTFAYFVFRVVQSRDFAWRGWLGGALVFFLIGGASFYNAIVVDLAGRDKQIAEGQTVPSSAAKSATEDNDASRRWIFVTNWSLPPSETLEFLWPRVNGDTSCPLTLSMARGAGRDTRPYTGAIGRPYGAKTGNYRQHAIYVGFITCLLALVGALSALGTRHRAPGTRHVILFFLVSAILFYLFSLGRYCEPVYRLIYALPMGDYLRAPVKWHHLTEFCLVVLAAFGLEYLRSFRMPKWVVPVIILLGAADLARIDHLYCAPVKLGYAEDLNCNLNLQMVDNRQIHTPQAQEMFRRGRLVYEAPFYLDPRATVIGVLDPIRPSRPEPRPVMPLVLGLISVLATFGVIVYTCRSFYLKSRTSSISRV